MTDPQCKNCFFFRLDAKTKPSPMRNGPQVQIFETCSFCTIRPPTGSRGFAETSPEMVCSLFTDAVTKAQPLKRCICFMSADGAEEGGRNG